MYITILANQSTMPPLKSLEAFLASHRIQVLSKEVLPVPRTLADRRYAEGWMLDAVDQDSLALVFSAVGLDDGVDVNAQLPTDRLADIKLAVFDMDSTLIECEVIDELARELQVDEIDNTVPWHNGHPDRFSNAEAWPVEPRPSH